MTVYLTRHGLREDWINKLWRSTALRPSDPPLSARGFHIAKELGIFSKTLGLKHIISSPMERCIQTSTAIADELDLPIKIDYGVIEWVGTDPGPDDILTPLSNEELKLKYPRVDLDYKGTTYNIPTRESIEELHDRTKIAVDQIIEKYRDDGPIIIVSHAATMIALGRGILNDNKAPLRSGVCSLSKFNLNTTNNKWELEYTGKADYMEDGEQSHWTFKRPVIEKP
ncbi:hypothetical protein ACTA71_004064 [Dictyostelium dimigraforme]